MAGDVYTIWPPLEQAYTDEFGELDPEVYAAAGQMWHKAEKLARDVLDDPGLKQQLLLRAVAKVTHIRCMTPERIDNLPGYLFKVYQRLLWYEVEKADQHQQLERKQAMALADDTPSYIEEIDRKILLEQVFDRLDDEMRFVFRMRVANHTFEEIAHHLKCPPHTLRTKFSKQLARLREQITLEIQSCKTGKKSSDQPGEPQNKF